MYFFKISCNYDERQTLINELIFGVSQNQTTPTVFLMNDNSFITMDNFLELVNMRFYVKSLDIWTILILSHILRDNCLIFIQIKMIYLENIKLFVQVISLISFGIRIC